MTSDPGDSSTAALRIIQKLRAHGHRALLAGGCVRDRLLNLPPKDFDVVTDATPDQVLKMFPQARKVGAKFGVVLVRLDRHDIEVATFRADGPYSDGRHPDHVIFGTEADDARRRDFTINGMFYDPEEDRIIDYVGGRADLAAGILRTIGDPGLRFAEDHLRMLRAVRFAARLQLRIEAATLTEIQRLAPQLRTVSRERVWLELEIMLTAPTRAVAWTLLLETGLRPHLIESWIASPEEDRLIGKRFQALPPRLIDAELAVAVLFASRPPEEAARFCRDLRLSNRQVSAVTWLVSNLPACRAGNAIELADLKQMMSGGPWESLIELLRVELIATDATPGAHESLCRRAAGIPANQVSPAPLLDGNELSRMGMPPGRRFGEVLDAVYRAQLNEQLGTIDQARALAREMM